MKTEIGCAVLLCLMGGMAGAATSGNIARSIESDPIDFLDMPDVPSQYQPVVIAQVSQARDSAKTDRSIGICALIDNPPNAPREPWTAGNSMSPALAVRNYFRIVEDLNIEHQGARVSILENPKHGSVKTTSSGGYHYIPEPGYLGKDSVTFLVEVGGYKVKAVHFLSVFGGVADEWYEDKKYCPNGRYWKISTTSDGNLVVTSVENQSPITGISTVDAATNLLNTLTVDPSAVTFTIADLPNGAVGQAVGNTIINGVRLD
jgi:hypothetical protein